MDEPVDYGVLAGYLNETRGYAPLRIPTGYFSNWLSNRKARLQLGWRPQIDMAAMVDMAWDYDRAPSDPRKIWYPG